jgi:drug/metabolite transporter (DMT)-like permease
MPWLETFQNLNRGDLLTLVCALGFSLLIIALDHGAKHVQFEQLTLLQVGFAMLFLTAGAGFSEPRMFAHLDLLPGLLTNPVVLFAVAATGILATALAFSIQTWAQGIIPATNIAVIITLEPVFAWLTAFFVLHESLQLRRAFGAGLVLLGILAAELLPRWRRAGVSRAGEP